MKKRNPEKWSCLPGGFDELHLRLSFRSSSVWGIPDLLPQEFITLPDDFHLIPYRTRRDSIDRTRDIGHCYLNDEQFRPVWSTPLKAMKHAIAYWGMVGPDFSITHDMPPALQAFQAYRIRWVERLWQEHGIRVIPTVTWTPVRDAYPLFFAGVPRGQIVSVRMFNTRNNADKISWVRCGWIEMIERLDPALVLLYGKLEWVGLRHGETCNVIEVAPDWDSRFNSVKKQSAKRLKGPSLAPLLAASCGVCASRI
jgi:hypothetical protein